MIFCMIMLLTEQSLDPLILSLASRSSIFSFLSLLAQIYLSFPKSESIVVAYEIHVSRGIASISSPPLPMFLQHQPTAASRSLDRPRMVRSDWSCSFHPTQDRRAQLGDTKGAVYLACPTPSDHTLSTKLVTTSLLGAKRPPLPHAISEDSRREVLKPRSAFTHPAEQLGRRDVLQPLASSKSKQPSSEPLLTIFAQSVATALPKHNRKLSTPLVHRES